MNLKFSSIYALLRAVKKVVISLFPNFKGEVKLALLYLSFNETID
jgi:hypothetical protein